MRFHAHRVDHGIGPDAAGHFHQGFADMGLLEIDDLGAEFLRQFEPMGMVVDADDLLGPHQHGALHGKQAHRSGTPDGDRVARLDLGVFSRHPAGGQDVGEEQDLVIIHAVGNDDRPDIGKRHPHIFRLAAGIAAGEVGIAEQAADGMAVEHFGGVLLFNGIAVVAGRILQLLAVEALAAGNGEGHHDALALLERALGANLDHFAHEFMAQDIARFHAGDDAVIKVQVGTADRRGGHLEDDIARIDDFGVGMAIDAYVMGAVPGQCAHQ